MKTKQKPVRTFDVLGGKGYALSFPPIGGGMVSTRAEKTKWTFRTLTDIKGNTRYHIGYVDKHSDGWHEVTKDTFHKVQKQLRARVMPNDPSSATRPTGRHDCNRSARAGFAAAHG